MNLIRAGYERLERLGNAYVDTVDRVGNALMEAERPRQCIAQIARNTFYSMAAAALVTAPLVQGIFMSGALALSGFGVSKFIEDPLNFERNLSLLIRSTELIIAFS